VDVFAVQRHAIERLVFAEALRDVVDFKFQTGARFQMARPKWKSAGWRKIAGRERKIKRKRCKWDATSRALSVNSLMP
jgi:hypothetical protein